jgi:magnesium transporter
MDALYGSCQTLVDRIDDRLDDLENELLASPDAQHLTEISELKRRIAELKRTTHEAREYLGGGRGPAIEDLPGMTENGRHYVRDLSETMRQLADDIVALEDRSSSLVDLHMTFTSNRQNVIMARLALIATIFLPLSFLVAFFGQNFNKLIDVQTGWVSFILLGPVLEAVSIVAILSVLRRRGWR